ncbi:MAG: IS1595 family transposase [Proteobacteria bacterium]|nr:IS1595 family transposase [Pseudomonadota bacterium]
MCTDLTNPIYHDEDKARKHLEASRWPNGPYCPHCGTTNVHRMAGKTQSGMFLCRECRSKFTVRVGTIFERSHIPLRKWLLGFRLMAASKKGMSAHQLHRSLGITYKSAWFMAHRIREAMTNPNASPIGGENKVVEVDETFIGGKAKNRAYRKTPPKKQAVMTLVERDGEARSFHVANVSAKALRPAIVKTASRKSYLMTDESRSYVRVGREFAGHGTVVHSANEYVRGGFWHVNTAESYFSILKRGVFGTFHNVSEAHLHRYLAEFDFRFNTRKIDDATRTALAIKGAEGKRLTYRQPDETAHA